MVTEGFEQYYKLGKNFMNPWSDMGKTFIDICRRANQGGLEIAGENLNRAADQLKRFSNVKQQEEVLGLQKECLNENITAWKNDIQKLINLSLGSFEELNKAFTSNLKESQQNAVNAATKGTDRERTRS